MSTYAWVIDNDHLHESDPTYWESINVKTSAGVLGPRDITRELQRDLKDGKGTPFRMYDDDGELYFSGRFVGDDSVEDAFGPLRDFGMPDSGCTEIRYKQSDGSWQTL